MKLVSLLIITFIFSGFISCNKKIQKNEENKNLFINSCITTAKKETRGMFKEEDINAYCDCAANKALGEFTVEEMLQLNNAEEGVDVQKRLMEVIQPCVEELSKKAQH